MSKIDGDTQVGCVPWLFVMLLIGAIAVLSSALGRTMKRVDALERAAAGKDAK